MIDALYEMNKVAVAWKRAYGAIERESEARG